MSLAAQLAACLGRAWNVPVAIEGLARIPGGASRETWRFDAVAGSKRKALILRRDPGESLIETERRTEFAALACVHGHLPAPQPLLIEPEGAELGAPFFIMERIDGGSAASPFTPDPYGPHAETLGRAFFTHLGALARIDPAGFKGAAAPAPDACWHVALDHWAGVIEADELHPQPIVRAAIRRLRAHPPPPAERVAIVHGDFRTGNFLHDGAGKLLAILDWELAHLGDPLEDLAWALEPMWNHFDESRVGGMLARDEAIALWEQASGLRADSQALAWWSLFASVKGQAIWTSSAKAFLETGRRDPILAISGWFTARRQDEILAAQLERWPL
jgi:aminoglycoside phosphotransferase (APT) family kinase protein